MRIPDRLKLGWFSSLSPWRLALLVAFCSMAALLVFWRIVPSDSQTNENSDYLNFYEPVAQNLLAGKGLVTNSGQPATHYPPAYPLLLVAAFKLASWFSLSTATANLALTLVSHLLAAVFIFLLARKLWSNLGAFIAALAWISYPPILWLTKQPNSEIPFMAVFYGSVWLLWAACWRRASWHYFVLAGMLGGIAALLRPIGLGAMVMMSLGLVLATRGKEFRLRLMMVAFLLIGNLLAIFPWQVWVYARTGNVVLLSGNLVPSIRDGLRFAVNLKRYRQAVPVPDDVRAMMQRIDARFDEMDSLANVAKVVRDEASPQPMALVKLLLIKAARSWYATDSGRREGLILLFQIVYLVLVAIGGWRAWKSGGQARELFFGLALTLLYFWGMTVLTLSILRYMTPVIGLAFTLLGALAPSTARQEKNTTSSGILGVMHLTDTLDSGGAERMAVNLVNHLPRDRYRVHLCTTRRDGALSDFVAADVERLRLERTSRFDFRAIFKLRRYIAEREIRLLHAHNTSLFIALAAAAFPPFPAVIWHHHTGRYAMEDRAARIYRLVAQRIRGVITVNQDLADWTQRRLGIPSERVRYIPNFVSESPLHPPIELPGTPSQRIVCVANLHPDKDHATLFRAMRQVIKQVPNAQLLLAGEARNAHYLQSITMEMVKLGLINNVTLLGQQKNIPQLLSACDIGVLSSVSEGLPMAVLEYGMAGLAVATTDVGQCAEVLDFGNAGLIVPKSDPDRLTESLVSLLESAELRRSLGEKLQARVRERYSANAVITEVCRMYEEVLHHNSAQISSER
ncbi:MAG: glycosyltransferase [Acidobacteria bacterium]|nr:glycosyltransferase [Acidobacteriota bacterium]